jgi:hypothetical protein
MNAPPLARPTTAADCAAIYSAGIAERSATFPPL